VSDLTAVSLFAGIGGFDLALERSGADVVAAVEINEECRGVLARHFPQTALFNDVTEVTGDQLRAAGFVPERGIITGGFPCQDLSVAGRRKGLAGARSGLFWHVMRLADELHPRWLLLENVPGLLSSVCPCPGDGTCVDNGRSVECGEWRGDGDSAGWFPLVLHAIPGGACPAGCMAAHGGAMGTVLGALGERGYGFAYRVLDARYFGVPQRRERVFIAGCLGDRAAPVEVLLEPESGEGNHAAGRGPRKGTAAATGGGTVSTLQGGGRRGYRIDAEGAAGGHLVAVPVQDGRGFDKAQNGTGLGAAGDPSYTLDTTGAQSVAAFPVALRGREGGSQIEAGDIGDPMFTLRTPGGGSSHPMVAMAFNPQTGGSRARIGYGEMPTALSCTQSTGVVYGVSENQRGEVIETPYSRQLTTGGGKPGQGYGAVRQGTAVRRLTPLERERLQGFPDDWTRWKLKDGRLAEQPDSARDRQTGNAVAVPVVEWITRRIVAVEAAQATRRRGAA
jgi:DNA (cytosine-5)-methyltransferase 1